jgi:TRAP-type mannitol/chloroaromatic compound transport system permease small subunit
VLYLLSISRIIDNVNKMLGVTAALAVLLACLISAGNAIIRYLFDASSNAWLEIQWYLFAVTVLLGAAATLERNGHVRIDLVSSLATPRTRLWIDFAGTLIFLLPAAAVLTVMSWPLFETSFAIDETSGNAGGLLRWPVKFLLPFGFFMLFLQGISELIKTGAALAGVINRNTHYEAPLQ